MSKQASPLLIGSFVMGAMAVLVIFVLIIAGDSFNRQSERYVVYFSESVNGLNVGSNVMFRGVPIGVVSKIDIVANGTTAEFFVPVYVDIYENSITTIPGTEAPAANPDDKDSFQRILTMGLRAALKTESLITGQLFINLDFFPNEPIVMRGYSQRYREIPSITTGIEAFLENTRTVLAEFQEGLDVKKFGEDLGAVTAGLNTLINDPETQQVATELNIALTEVSKTFARADRLLGSAEDGAGNAADSLTATLAELEKLLLTINNRLDENSDTTYRINATLQEIEGAARSIRVLSDYLQTNPEALVTGKEPQ